MEAFPARAGRVAIVTAIAIGLIGSLSSAQLLPDLVVAEIATEPANPRPEQAVTVVATIENQGRGAVTRRFQASIRVGEELVRSGVVATPGGLAAGESTEVRGEWQARAGEHTIEVEVDPFERVEESDASNNTRSATIAVAEPDAVRSITGPLMQATSRALQGAGAALQVEMVADTFQLIERFRAAFETAQQAFGQGARTLRAQTGDRPQGLPNASQLESAARLAERFATLASQFETASKGLARSRVAPLLEAFERIRDTIREMAEFAEPPLAVSPVATTAELLDQALAEADKLKAALNGEPNVDVEGAKRTLVALINEIGTAWTETGAGLQERRDTWAPEFRNGDGEPVRRYRAGRELVITAPSSEQLALAVYNSQGDRVALTSSEPERPLTWQGTDGSGEPLPAGDYGYRLLVAQPDPPIHVEIGTLRIAGDGTE